MNDDVPCNGLTRGTVKKKDHMLCGAIQYYNTLISLIKSYPWAIYNNSRQLPFLWHTHDTMFIFIRRRKNWIFRIDFPQPMKNYGFSMQEMIDRVNILEFKKWFIF